VTGGSTMGRRPVYRRRICRVGTHARSSPSGVIYVGKGIRYLTRATTQITPRKSISLYPTTVNRQVYTNILSYIRSPQCDPKFTIGKSLRKAVKASSRSSKNIWLSTRIYVYLLHNINNNKGYDKIS